MISTFGPQAVREKLIPVDNCSDFQQLLWEASPILPVSNQRMSKQVQVKISCGIQEGWANSLLYAQVYNTYSGMVCLRPGIICIVALLLE